MKYFLGILGVVFVLILIIVIAVRGGSDTVPAPEVRALAEYAQEPNTTARFLTSGAISSEENHQSVKIRVTSSLRSVEIVEGYNGDVVKRKTYPNTTAAFESFLAGVEQVGFTKERRTRLSFESVCPTGRRFAYAMNSDGEEVVDAWTATCERGSYGGERNTTQKLFQAQIPDYTEFIRDVNFSL